MQTFSKLCFSIALIASTFSPLAASENNSVESISPEVRSMLTKEMIAIQKGIMDIIPAYASGDTKAIASIARNIKESYILKQALSPEQKRELHHKLPANFVALDEKFHYYAGMLEHVADNRKHELISFYLSKLTESCAGCHSQYATHKFPKLKKMAREKEHRQH